MTAVEVYEMTTQGGATDFARVIEICDSLGSYCLIGGLAVNCYVEPVYTVDADLVLVPDALSQLMPRLKEAGFMVSEHPHSVNAQPPSSSLRVQFTTDERYRDFPVRAQERTVLEQTVRVAALEDVFQGKLWDGSNPARRLIKREKARLDLLRLAEVYPALLPLLPAELRALFP